MEIIPTLLKEVSRSTRDEILEKDKFNVRRIDRGRFTLLNPQRTEEAVKADGAVTTFFEGILAGASDAKFFLMGNVNLRRGTHRLYGTQSPRDKNEKRMI